VSLAPLPGAQPDDPIKHVIVLMFENRSFDQMLGCFQTLRPGLDGLNPDQPRSIPDKPNSKTRIKQQPSTARTLQPGPFHDMRNVLAQINRRPGLKECEGFVYDYVLNLHGIATPAQQQEIMNYYALDTLPALHALARNFLICDHWFSSLPGPTWPNRFFVHTGTSIGITSMATGLNVPFNQNNQATIYDRLNERSIPWRIYYGDIPQTMLLVRQRHAENRARYRHMEHFANDLNDADAVPAYTVMEPNYMPLGQNDYHPPSDVLAGEAFLSTVFNAIRSSTSWTSTLFIVVFDEHGGCYDHVYPPRTATRPDDHQDEFDFTQYGVRVPALLISPYVDATYNDTVFDHTSILRYVIEKHGLAPLGERVTNAKSIGPLLRATPRNDTITHIPATQPDSPIQDTIGDPPMVKLDPGQEAAVHFALYLDGAPLTPGEQQMMRNAFIRQSADGHITVAASRVRDYLDNIRPT